MIPRVMPEGTGKRNGRGANWRKLSSPTPNRSPTKNGGRKKTPTARRSPPSSIRPPISQNSDFRPNRSKWQIAWPYSQTMTLRDTRLVHKYREKCCKSWTGLFSAQILSGRAVLVTDCFGLDHFGPDFLRLILKFSGTVSIPFLVHPLLFFITVCCKPRQNFVL